MSSSVIPKIEQTFWRSVQVNSLTWQQHWLNAVGCHCVYTFRHSFSFACPQGWLNLKFISPFRRRLHMGQFSPVCCEIKCWSDILSSVFVFSLYDYTNSQQNRASLMLEDCWVQCWCFVLSGIFNIHGPICISHLLSRWTTRDKSAQNMW